MRTIVVFLSVLMILNNSYSQTGEKRIALVIGNTNYKEGQLTFPRQDAQTMKTVLEELNFEVVYRLDATKSEMSGAFVQFIRKAENSNISLIYYSGHGMQIDGVNHLIPIDANNEDIHSAKATTISINNWVNQLEGSDQNAKIIILDACRNNPYKSFAKSPTKGLSRIEVPIGSIISFATQSDNVAQDNGLFASTLAAEMRKPQRISDVFMNTRVIIRSQTKGQQNPMEWTMLNGHVFLKEAPAESVPAEKPSYNSNPVVKTVEIKWSSEKNGYFVDPRDNKDYRIVKIGNQIWMAENLQATKYNDGTNIPIIIEENDWKSLSSPAFCWYDNDESTYGNTSYGALYNWYTIAAGKLCPVGWHVPDQIEWTTLMNFYADENGDILRARGSEHWNKRSKSATNRSGFTAVAGGRRTKDGSFLFIKENAYWWSGSEVDRDFAYDSSLSTYFKDSDLLIRTDQSKNQGASIRCVMD